MRHRAFPRVLLSLALAVAAAASAGAPPPRGDRAAFAAEWRGQGLQPVPTRSFDLLYLRPGAGASLHALEIAPVEVRMREDWQRANHSFERARLRPGELQKLEDEVAAIVADELHRALDRAPGTAGPQAPVLQARVVDLYLNAPDLQSAVASRTYTDAFGDMVFVAEVREGRDGRLLLASWDHRPAREFVAPRQTTRVDNAIEVRVAAHAWAKLLRRELDRLGAGR